MALIGLLLLQGAALTGLMMGRRALAMPLLATVPATTQLAGVGAGALALLAAAGLGAHLHRLVAEEHAR